MGARDRPSDLAEAVIASTVMFEAIVEDENMIRLALPLADEPRARLDCEISR
jgi:hypothetical protein